MNKTRKCAGREAFQRINYLHQASNCLATENATSNIASSLYSNLLISISKRTVQRIDIDMKRSICKGCRSLLLAGVTCKVRIKKKKILWSCLKCKTTKVFDIRKNKTYIPWTQRKESIVEILDYSQQENEKPTKGNEFKKNSEKNTDQVLVPNTEVIPMDPGENQQMTVDN